MGHIPYPAPANIALPQRPFGHAFVGSASGGDVGTMTGGPALVCSVRGGVGRANRWQIRLCMHAVLFYFLTALGTLAFVLGVVQLFLLRKLVSRKSRSRNDPFDNIVGVLFTTSHQDPDLTRRQRFAIWTFCIAILLLFAARFSLTGPHE